MELETSLNVTVEGSPSDPIEVCIYLRGHLAHIPSKSNTNRIKPVYNRKLGRSIARITNSPAVKAYNEEFMQAYTTAWVRLGLPLPSFGSNLVTVSIGLAHRPGRWDSPNVNKLVCDTLKKCGLYHDDKQCEAHAYKRSEYAVFRTDLDMTTIIINRRRKYPHVSI